MKQYTHIHAGSTLEELLVISLVKLVSMKAQALAERNLKRVEAIDEIIVERLNEVKLAVLSMKGRD